MSTEKIINADTQNLTSFTTPKTVGNKRTARVDINHLLARVRKEKETLTNLVFVGLALSLILVVGLILSF